MKFRIFLLFLFSAIAYLDRINMSIAGKPMAHEFGLSLIALGYLFSAFLWAYVLMMLPGGRLIDRWGPHVVASVATAVWSTAQMATGMVGSFATMLMVRFGLGVGEAPFASISCSSVRRLWSPYTERGTAKSLSALETLRQQACCPQQNDDFILSRAVITISRLRRAGRQLLRTFSNNLPASL